MMKKTLIKKIVDSYEEIDAQPLCDMLNAFGKAELFDKIQQGLDKDEDTRTHDVIELRKGTEDVYINGILCKSVFDIEFEKDVHYGCFGHVGSDLLTTVTVTFKVPDVTVK